MAVLPPVDALVQFVGETFPLLFRVAQLGIGIGELNSTDIELEPLSNARISRFQPRQRTPPCRIFNEEHRFIQAQSRFYVPHHDLVEQVAVQRLFHHHFPIAFKSLPDGQRIPRAVEGYHPPCAEKAPGRSCGASRSGNQCFAILHQGGIVRMGAVPFEHGEFREVQPAPFTIPPAVA